MGDRQGDEQRTRRAEEELRQARRELARLRQLDPDDCVGGALLEAVRVRALVGPLADDDSRHDDAYTPAFGAAAWVQAGGRPAAA